MNFLDNFYMYWVWFSFGMIIEQVYGRISGCKKTIKYLIGILAVGLVFIRLKYYIPDILVSLTAVLASYAVMPSKRYKVLDLLSDNSFGVYLFHSPLIYITYSLISNESPILVVFINLFIFGGAALLISVLVRKSKIRFIIGM